MNRNSSNTNSYYLSIILNVILIVSVFYLTYLITKKPKTENNLEVYLKLKVDSLSNEIKINDSLYLIKSFEKDKFKVIRETINTDKETKTIIELKKELEYYKSLLGKNQIRRLTPDELNNYFNDLINNKK